MNNRRSTLFRALSVLLALALWQGLAEVIGHSLLLVGPLEVVARLANLLAQPDFWATLFFTFCRIETGFFLGLAAGVLLAGLSYRFPPVEYLLWPYVVAIKSTPVASFIIVSLIWLDVRSLSVFIGFLMVLPLIYFNLLEGLKSSDPQLLQMAALFEVPWRRRLLYLYLPQVWPFLLSACSAALGLSWKAGVAAEVIGIPDGSIGERLYEAKVYLSTGDLFAWTIVIVVVSVAFEKLFLALLRAIYRRLETL
ncbi:MAG: ABC transporter permease subunit [Clostridia bacterium]|nr:ABC transporter permease subunit [Clostridia bacterium]